MGMLAGPILASVAGSAVSGMMADDAGGQTTTNEPWSGIQPYLRQLYEGASGLLGEGGGFPYYPGSTVAGRSPFTSLSQATMLDRLGQSGIFGQGMAPASDLLQSILGSYNPSQFGWMDLASGNFGPSSTYGGQAAISSLMPTAMGEMLGSNPYLDAMFQGAASQVGDQFRTQTMPAMQSMFSRAGRYGPGAAMSNEVDLANQGFGSTLNRLASNIYGQNYAQERQNQMAAAQQLGQFGVGDVEAQLRGLGGLQTSSQYDIQNQMQMLPYLLQNANQDLSMLSGLGTSDQAYNQSLIDADRARWNFMTQQSGFQPLQQFASLLGSIQTPSSGQTTQQADPMSSIFGGAQIGRAMYDQFFPKPSFTPSYSLGGTGAGLGGGTSSYGLNPFTQGSGLGLQAPSGGGSSSMYSLF